MNKLVQQLDRIDPYSAASQNLIRELMAASKKPESKPTSKPTSKPASKPRPEFDNKAEIESATYNDQSAERALCQILQPSKLRRHDSAAGLSNAREA